MEFEIIQRIIAEQLHIAKEFLQKDTAFDDLGADSLDVFQVISALEEEFNIEISLDEVDNMKNITDLIRYIKDFV